YHGWFEDDSRFYIAMDFARYGDLESHISHRLPERETALIMVQITRAVRCIHEHNFIHRDLKPSNILVVRRRPTWHVKVADFGVAKNIQGMDLHTSYMGTRGFMAPEIYSPSSLSAYTAAVDMWSLGTVAFRVRTGRLPWDSKDEKFAYYNNISSFPDLPLVRSGSSKRCKTFIEAVMARKPVDRLTAEQALGHKWLRRLGNYVDMIYNRCS
ncbi:kinase-like protein, partial [Hypoxylon sp. EC38]